jgi:hypothetical protein
MDTLPQSEKKTAQEGKKRVIAAMGLNDYAPGAKQASAAPEAAPPSSSGSYWGMFDMFGSSKPAPPPAPAAAPVQAAEPAPSPAPSTSASAVITRKQADARPPKPAPAPKVALAAKSRPQPQAQPPVRIASIQPASLTPASSANGFMIVFGSVGSESAGRGRAQQIKTALADILVNREVEVEAGAAGGYLIVAGPYKAKGTAAALCSVMKQRGVSCQVSP